MLLRSALPALALIGFASGAADAGQRCIRPRPTKPEPAEPVKVEKPTLKQLRTAIEARQVTLGGAVGYALTYGGGEDATKKTCESTHGASGTATTVSHLSSLVTCMFVAPAVSSVPTGRKWKAVSAKQVPKPLKALAGDLTGFGKDHLIATSIRDTKRAKEGDVDYYALFVAHREGETIVIDAVYATERVWIK